MPVLPDLRSLYEAADAVDRTAGTVEADTASLARMIDGLPWRGPRRDLIAGSATLAVGAAGGQAAEERALARALRALAIDVEHELRVLAELADRARRHLEELLRRARALVEATAAVVADAAAQVGPRVVIEVVTFDPVGALREARRLADQAVDRMRSVMVRLHTLPEPRDPAWRQLGPEILGWRPA